MSEATKQSRIGSIRRIALPQSALDRSGIIFQFVGRAAMSETVNPQGPSRLRSTIALESVRKKPSSFNDLRTMLGRVLAEFKKKSG